MAAFSVAFLSAGTCGPLGRYKTGKLNGAQAIVCIIKNHKMLGLVQVLGGSLFSLIVS